MSEDILNSDEPLQPELTPEEVLEGLKQKAKSLGIRFHPSIKEEKLRAKILDHHKEMERQAKKIKVTNQSPELQMELAKQSISSTQGGKSLREIRQQQLELVRVRVNPLNVHMNGLKGQVFSVINGVVGEVKKYVPFNSPYGWHIPRILLDEIESKQYQTFREFKTPTGKTVMKNELAKAYAVEILPPLTDAELASIQENIRSTDGQEDY